MAEDKRPFHIALPPEIKAGEVTDVYFRRAEQVLDHLGRNPHVRGEVYCAGLPDDWGWAILAGVEELAHLMEGLPVDVESIPEGGVFRAGDPVVVVSGPYRDFAVFETIFLGLLCQASGVATRAALCRLAAGERGLYSFGARRMHPALAPMIERSAFIGGCDGVAVVKSAELIGEAPVGTMSHSLVLAVGSEPEAFQAFDEAVDPAVPRVALVDTFQDEKFGALTAAEVLGERLDAVRLDTPRSRRGNFEQIIREVRWELDMRGFGHVRIFVSGGLNASSVRAVAPWVDGYGVGTWISNAPVVDFSFDLVEVEGQALAKRGKRSGLKTLWRCEKCLKTYYGPAGTQAPECHGGAMLPYREALVTKGVAGKQPEVQEIRSSCLNQLGKLQEGESAL